MQYAANARRRGVAKHVDRIRFRLARMQHNGPMQLGGESDLRVEGTTLLFARSVIVVIVESTLADRNGANGNGLANGGPIAQVIPRVGVVRVHAARVKNEPWIAGGDALRAQRRGRRFADTHKGPRTCCAGPLDDRVHIVCERGIGQMYVTVGEHRRLVDAFDEATLSASPNDLRRADAASSATSARRP